MIVLGLLACPNYVAYKTLWRDYRTEAIEIPPDQSITEVVKTAEGDDLEEKIHSVINETIIFHDREESGYFRKQLKGYLDSKGYPFIAETLSLEDKISLGLGFSSSLKYNYKANFMTYAANSKGIGEFLVKSAGSMAEFTKINLMDAEELVKYEDVVCINYAEVFAQALHEIDAASANPAGVHVGTILFVPNGKVSYGKFYDSALSVINAVLFSEWRSSEPHAINIVATDDKIYIVDPQLKHVEHFEELEINKEYVKEFKK